MKVSLSVLTPGKMHGKAIPITLSQFLIGRDSQCHMRPASVLISNRHCVLLQRAGQVFIRDLNSTNGTFVNDQPIKEEVELTDHDKVRIGPIAFEIRIENAVPIDQPTPIPPTRQAASVESPDEAAAALLLSLQDDTTAASSLGTVDEQGVPTGNTVLNGEGLQAGDNGAASATDKEGAAARHAQAKKAQADTSVAAKEILTKYLRRRG